jgi:hypothetical protein
LRRKDGRKDGRKVKEGRRKKRGEEGTVMEKRKER